MNFFFSIRIPDSIFYRLQFVIFFKVANFVEKSDKRLLAALNAFLYIYFRTRSLCCVFIQIAETWPSFDRLFCDLEGQQATTAPSAVTGAPVGPADLGRYHVFFFFCLLNLEDIVWLYWIRCATKNDDTKALGIVYTIRYIWYCTHTTYLEEELERTELMPFWLLTKVENKLN